ncbi:hypothetical protein FRC12_000373 [Ceratobasidium sp. 428]|nr:hypothetical protein FRC12_000373 [Ceratobasidium sp. 428]
MAVITWSYDIAPAPLGKQAGLGTNKSVHHVRLSSTAGTVVSAQAFNDERVSVDSILPGVIIFGILVVGLILAVFMAFFPRRSKLGPQTTPHTPNQDIEGEKGRELLASLEEDRSFSTKTGCISDHSVGLFGFVTHNESLLGHDIMPHSRASSSILIVRDDGPMGTFLRPPPVGRNIPVVPSSQIRLDAIETPGRISTPTRLEHYPLSRHATMRSMTTSDNLATHGTITKPPPALVTPDTLSLTPSSFDSVDTISFTYARLQATMRSTRSRTTSAFPRASVILPPVIIKSKKRASTIW